MEHDTDLNHRDDLHSDDREFGAEDSFELEPHFEELLDLATD